MKLHILGGLNFDFVYIIGSDIFLHGDKDFMPQNPKAWSAWNFVGNKNNNSVCLTYWLNVLQVIRLF